MSSKKIKMVPTINTSYIHTTVHSYNKLIKITYINRYIHTFSAAIVASAAWRAACRARAAASCPPACFVDFFGHLHGMGMGRRRVTAMMREAEAESDTVRLSEAIDAN